MKPKILRWMLLAGFLAVIVLLCISAIVRHKRLGLRRSWKAQAIPVIVRAAEDENWISREVGLLSGAEPTQDQRVIAEGWLSDRMILMESGEWLIYESHCQKEPPHDVSDIFIAKSSTNKWYYSTCHFCVDMVALTGMQWENLTDLTYFIQRYHLREFDGRSDECLKETKTFPDQL